MTAATARSTPRIVDARRIDLAREDRILELQQALSNAPDYAIARSVWPMLQAEVNARSAQQVLRMERERGLRDA